MFLALALALFAQTKNFTPADFPVAPCAPENSCRTFTDSEIVSAAFRFYALQLDMDWVLAHRAAVLKDLEGACKRHATCLATPGTTFWFCDDVLASEAQSVCPKLFPNDKQCPIFISVYLLGIDIKAEDLWKRAQACAAKSAAQQHTKPLEVWMQPDILPPHFKGKITFFARDADTHLPVYAKFKFENEIVYAPASPEGLPAMIYPFDYTPKFKRVPNADGHTDVVPPTVLVTAPYYPDQKFQLAAEIPKVIVNMRREKNTITIEAKDVTTGKPVEMRVMLGDDPIGETNKAIALRKNQRGEIWLRSMFDAYSDVVVAKAR